MSVRPPVLLLFISRRVFYLIWYFVVRSTVYNCLPRVLPLLVLVSVRLLQVFGRVFGCHESLAVCLVIRSVWPCVRLLQVLAVCSAVRSVWPCVRLFQVFGRVFGCLKCLAVCSAATISGRVFGCYKCLAVCSAVTISDSVFSCYKRWPCVRPFQVLVGFGFVIFFMFLFVRFSTCFGLCPFILFLAPSFFLVVPSVLFRHVLSGTHIFSWSFYSSFYFVLLFGSLYVFAFPLHSLRAYSALFWS